MKNYILNIETSTSVCSVALSEDEDCIFKKSDFNGKSHAALLSVFIEEAMSKLRKREKKLSAVAVSAGPGSYTGLRIGISTAKGLCFGYEIPLIAVDTLQVMFVDVISKIIENEESTLFCPMIDARRMEVYNAIFDNNGVVFRGTMAEIINENSFLDLLKNHKIYFFGDGSDKCKGVINHENSFFVSDIFPLAEKMISLSTKKLAKQNFVDVAYFEPFYLKEFQTTASKKRI